VSINRITIPNHMVGRTIVKVVNDWTHQIGLVFSDGTWAFLEADGRSSESRISLQCSPDNDTALALGAITTERHAEAKAEALALAISIKRAELARLEKEAKEGGGK